MCVAEKVLGRSYLHILKVQSGRAEYSGRTLEYSFGCQNGYLDMSLPWESTYAHTDIKSLGSVRPRRRHHEGLTLEPA